MSRLTPLPVESATGKSQDLFAAVKGKLGMVPNMMRTMAHSPEVLEGYLGLSGALGRGTLSAKVREQIALVVSEANGCDYCLAAHAALGRMVGLTAEQIGDSRRGEAIDPKVDAILRFARKIVDHRGQVNDADLAEVREAGYSDAAIAEVVAHVALSVFTNYFNIVAATEVDFPPAPALAHHQHQ